MNFNVVGWLKTAGEVFVLLALAGLLVFGCAFNNAPPVTAEESHQVTIAQYVARMRPSADSNRLAKAFTAAGRKCAIDPRLVAAVAAVESSLRVDAESETGARGLMQLVRSTSEAEGLPWEYAYDVERNVTVGACYLAKHINSTGRVDRALARYNGEGHPLADPLFAVKVLAAYRSLGAESAAITVARGDTLAALAATHLGDPMAYRTLAEYNGIENPDRIEVGQKILLPPRHAGPNLGAA